MEICRTFHQIDILRLKTLLLLQIGKVIEADLKWGLDLLDCHIYSFFIFFLNKNIEMLKCVHNSVVVGLMEKVRIVFKVYTVFRMQHYRRAKLFIKHFLKNCFNCCWPFLLLLQMCHFHADSVQIFLMLLLLNHIHKFVNTHRKEEPIREGQRTER